MSNSPKMVAYLRRKTAKLYLKWSSLTLFKIVLPFLSPVKLTNQ